MRSSHVALQYLVSKLLQDLFGVELEDIVLGLEMDVKSKIKGVRGKTDLLYHNIIFEIKLDFDRELDDARIQVRKYFQALLELGESNSIAVITDGLIFYQYAPVIENDSVTGIREISSINIEEDTPQDVLFWLDAILFSKTQIVPSADDLKFRYGVGSPTYVYMINEFERAFKAIKDRDTTKIKLDYWKKHMEIVYGKAPTEIGFVEQTYLVTLVKMIVYLRISQEKTLNEMDVYEVLTGRYFRNYGISNLVEEGYYSWITEPEPYDILKSYFVTLLKEITRYDLTKIDEDLFKELYQEIVRREDRHRVGEYYTPEWLAEITLREAFDYYALQCKQPPSILDPACGSGTFLTNAIHLLKTRGQGTDPAKLLENILNKVVGADINPLAVYIARANYLFALGDLLQYKKDIISIPIYVSDTFKLNDFSIEKINNVDVYKIMAEEKILYIPNTILIDRYKYKEALNLLEKSILIYNNSNKDRSAAISKFEEMSNVFNQEEKIILKETLEKLFDLIDQGKNSVWLFILSNLLAPLQFTVNKFDIVVGNPPWIAMRYIENTDYQNYVKQRMFDYELISPSDIQLFSNIEMATVFFTNSVDKYLKNKGIISFVMPRSILTGALQHIKFKAFKNPQIKLMKIFDFEKVSPLFNVPTCTILCLKDEETTYPVPIFRYRGKFDVKNSKFAEANNKLTLNEESYSPPLLEGNRSPYYDKLRMGARLAPRPFWFIEFEPHPEFGINPKLPKAKNTEDSSKQAKKEWKKVTLSGNLEIQYIFSTLLSRDVLPFGYREMRPVFIPAIIENGKYHLLDSDELMRRGDTNAAKWLDTVESYWFQLGTDKSKTNFPSILKRIDYQRLLSSQKNRRYVLVYAKAGKYLISTVIDKEKIPGFKLNNSIIKVQSFVAESDTWIFESDNENEAHYLCSLLNSDVLNEAVRPLQTRGLYGERDIHRRPFLFNIPIYDPNNTNHLRLSEISKNQHEIVKKLRSSIQSKGITGPRLRIKKILAKEIKEIDELVKQILNL